MFEHVFPEFGARAEFPQFWHFYPEPNFPKNLLLFWNFYPEPNFPKNLPQFWDFLQIQILGTFVLRFRYFEFTALDCRSLEFTIGPTHILGLLVVGTSIFLVPLTLRRQASGMKLRNQTSRIFSYGYTFSHVNPAAVPLV